MGRVWDRWARSVLGKVRLGALGFGLFTCLGPIDVLDGDFALERRLISVVSLALLATLFVVCWRLNRTFRLEPFLAAPLALGLSYGLSDSLIVIGTCLGVAASQSLYGRPWTFVVRTVLLVPVIPLAVLLTPSAGKDLVWTSPQVLTQSVLPVLVAFLIRTLRSTLLAQEQVLAREQIVASTGRLLFGLTEVDDVREVMRRATVEICELTPELVLVAATLSGGRLSVAATYGLPPPEGHTELPFELLRVADRSLATTPVPPEHVTAVRTVMGAHRHWYVMGMALDDTAQRDTVALVGLGDATPDSVLSLLSTLSTLGSQHSLAERACRSHGELTHQAHHDDLTGLPNRALLFHDLDRALRSAARAPVCLMIIDLDGFKGVNDTRGHLAGDTVLIEIGMRLRAVLDGVGLAARLGGDEFAILMSGLAPLGATDLAERLWARIGDPIHLGDDAGTIHIGASIGLAVADAPTEAGKLMGLADVAMYAAKTGGSRVSVLTAPRSGTAKTRVSPVGQRSAGAWGSAAPEPGAAQRRSLGQRSAGA